MAYNFRTFCHTRTHSVFEEARGKHTRESAMDKQSCLTTVNTSELKITDSFS